MASSGPVFAEPMLDGEEYLKEYLKQIVELRKRNLLPDLNANMNYTVYSLASGFGGHKSIILTTNGRQFVSVELTVLEIKGVNRIYPVSREIDKKLKPEMEYLGNIRATGKDLIVKAIGVMRGFGTYFQLTNNCQDFCNMYVEAIGLKQAQTLTDPQKTLLFASVGVIGAYALVSALR